MSWERTRPREPIAWSKRTGKAVKHGISSGYSTHGCGCDPCWESWQASDGHKREREINRRATDKRASS